MGKPLNRKKSLAKELGVHLLDMPAYLSRCNSGDKLWKILTDINFLEIKTEKGAIFDLANDFSRAVKIVPTSKHWHKILSLLEEALRREIHFIAKHPSTLFQCLWNLCWWYDCPDSQNYKRETSKPKSTEKDLKLSILLEEWHRKKLKNGKVNKWLRSLLPPTLPLNSHFRMCLRGHTSRVKTLDVSYDGKYIASGSDKGEIIVWDTETGKISFRFDLHDSSVNDLKFYDESYILISCSSDRTIRVWDCLNGESKCSIKGPDCNINSIAWTKDFKAIIAGCHDNTIRIYEYPNGNEVACLRGHENVVSCVSVFNNSNFVASGSWDGSIKIWDINKKMQVKTIKSNKHTINSITISHDDRFILSGIGAGEIDIWKLEDNSQLPFKELRSCKERVTISKERTSCVKFSLRGNEFLSSAADGSLRIWNAITGKQIFQYDFEHDITCAEYIPERTEIVFSSGTALWILDYKNLYQSAPLQKHICSSLLEFSIEGDVLITSSGNRVELRDSKTGGYKKTILKTKDTIERLIRSPVSNIFGFYVPGEVMIKLWDLDKRQKVIDIHDIGCDEFSIPKFAPSGKIIASPASDFCFGTWNALTGEHLNIFKGHSEPVIVAAFSPDEKLIASVSFDYTLRLWNSSTAEEVKTSELNNLAYDIEFSPSGKYIIISDFNKISFYDAKSLNEVSMIRGCGNVSDISKYSNLYPWFLLFRETEIVVLSSDFKEVGWFPAFSTAYSGNIKTCWPQHTFGFITSDKLQLIRLEGEWKSCSFGLCNKQDYHRTEIRL